MPGQKGDYERLTQEQADDSQNGRQQQNSRYFLKHVLEKHQLAPPDQYH